MRTPVEFNAHARIRPRWVGAILTVCRLTPDLVLGRSYAVTVRPAGGFISFGFPQIRTNYSEYREFANFANTTMFSGPVAKARGPCVAHPRVPSIARRRVETCASPSDDGNSSPQATRLAGIIKRKKERVERQVNELGEEDLEDRLSSAVMQGPGDDGFRFSQLISSVGMRRGGPLTIFEIARLDSFETSDDLAERATRLVECGADAIAVRLDEEASPEGMRDLFVVSRAVAARVPVFARDWYLHPLQIVDVKAAGATGVIGIVASVTQRGSPVLSSFGAALGLDCPVEIVNLNELKQMEGFCG